MREILRQGLAEQGLDVNSAEPLEAFARLVLERNRVMNLTAITAEEDFARLHLLDSTALASLVSLDGKRVIDVGTGAGFPGVPLRILRADLALTLLDSTGKRIEFLREACRTLGLDRVELIHGRAEELAAQRRETYDAAVSRAVASLPVLCELCLPLVRVGGQFLAMKSTRSDEELRNSERAIRELGGELNSVRDYPIPGSEIVHRLIVVDKKKPTPKKYPRAFGQIKKRPL